MAKNKETETRTSIDNLNDQLSSIEQKVQNNQKVIMWASIAVAVVICLVLAYVYLIRQPGIQAADNAIGQADLALFEGNDSLALAQYEQVAKEYGYAAGNRANFEAAMILYRNGEYQKALDYLNEYSAKDALDGAAALSLKGDCYVNLDNLDKALDCFKSAAKKSDKNPHLTPFFLMKEATIYHELKNYKEEAAIYQEIVDNYPEYGGEYNIDFEKYLKRAQTLAGE